MVRWAFDLLGIEVTKDKKLIKKAYAAKVRLCHPEEQPTGWERLHEAYQTALEYAGSPDELREESGYAHSSSGPEGSGDEYDAWGDGQGEEEPAVPPPEIRISPDLAYGEMFQEAQKQWSKERSLEELNLQQRLNGLFLLKGRKSVKEWERFFEQEFTLAERENTLLILFQEIQEAKLSEKVLRLILMTMNGRIREYVIRGKEDCARLSAAIVKYCATQDAALHRKNEKKKKLTLIPAALVVMFIIIGMAGLRKEHAVEDDITKMAASYLNEKYGGASYSTENLEAEEERVIGDFVGRMDSYAIRSNKTGVVIAYAMRGEYDKEGEYAFFDNIQEAEIREGFEKMVNTATGHEEGRLFWDSSTTDVTYGGIEDGFFHTKYEGDFLDFILHEAARRADTPTGEPKALAAEYKSMNGACDYYLPDPAVKTIDERLNMQETAKDDALLEALNACAEDYKVQIRCSVLPETLFQKRIAHAEENRYNVFVLNDIHETAGMRPAMSFLMLTGWYVSLPPDDGKLLGISNDMYMQPVLLMGEGIYGTEGSIGGQAFSGDPQWMTGSIVKTENPDIPEITEEESQRAVSFRLADGCVFKNNYALAIRKDQYGIADTGYRVFITKQEKTEMDVAGRHLEAPAGTAYEKYVCNYHDAGAILRQGDVMDGEGCLFIEYQAAENAETADIITIINP